MVGRGDLYSRQPHTTDTHGGEEGRSSTPTSWCHCIHTSYFKLRLKSTNSKKKTHLQKVMDALRTLKHNKQLNPKTQTTTWTRGGGGGLIAQHSGGVCAVLVVRLLPHPLHP